MTERVKEKVMCKGKQGNASQIMKGDDNIHTSKVRFKPGSRETAPGEWFRKT